MKKLIATTLLVLLTISISAQEEFKSYEEGGKFGVLDKSGKRITSAKYDNESFLYYNDLCKVEADHKYGYINKKGIELIPIIYEIGSDFKSDKAVVYKDTIVYYINTKAEVVSPRYKVSLAADFCENAFTFLITDGNGLKGFYNMWKGQIMPNFYDIIYASKNGMHAVKINDKYGFNDSDGNAIIPVLYDEVFNFNEKVAIVRIDSKYGVIDKTGKTIVPYKYYSINDFSEGLAVVNKGGYFRGKHGYIDEQGNEIIPIIYDVATDFKNGKAAVRLKDEEFYINTKGERIQ